MIFLLVFGSCVHAERETFQGTVVDSVTQRPMAGVHVVLRPANTQKAMEGEIFGAMSRADGTFSIGELAPGTYGLEARYPGCFLIPAKTPDGSDDAVITLEPGEQPKTFLLTMTPHAAIAGRVIDENGDPVPHVPVVAQAMAGEATHQARTDDRGQYRLPLAPGKYFVQAMGQGLYRGQSFGGFPEIRADGALPRVFGNTFYPSASGKDNATPIELEPGQDAESIDIRLAPGVGITIGGVVTGNPNGKPDGGPPAFVTLTRAASNLESSSMVHSETTRAETDGRFTIAGVAHGRYRIFAQAAQSTDGKPLQSAPIEIAAESGSVANPTLALAHGETLRGTVRLESDAAQSTAAEKLTVRLESVPGRGRVAESDTGADGTFHLDRVFPGKFVVRVTPLPENACIKSVKTGATESREGFIDLTRGGVNGARLDVIIRRDGGQMEGTVVGEDGHPPGIPLALVALSGEDVTADGTVEPDVKEVGPGKKFKFSGLRPGKYRLIAVDPRRLPAGEREALESVLSQAPEIEVHANDRISKNLKIAEGENAGGK
jgi:hypothetical protein